jgi:hypothetical protein
MGFFTRMPQNSVVRFAISSALGHLKLDSRGFYSIRSSFFPVIACQIANPNPYLVTITKIVKPAMMMGSSMK